MKTTLTISTLILAGCLSLIACTFAGRNKKITAKNEQLNSAVSNEVAKAKTIANMLGAFESETNASVRYAAFSKKAIEEGFHEIALLFKAASIAENSHAENHLAVLADMGINVHPVTTKVTLKSTGENLKSAIRGEDYVIDKMYPLFLKDARAAGNQLALISLNYAYKAERKHKIYYEKALAALNGHTIKNLPAAYYICHTCGINETPVADRCGIAMTSAEKFININSIKI